MTSGGDLDFAKTFDDIQVTFPHDNINTRDHEEEDDAGNHEDQRNPSKQHKKTSQQQKQQLKLDPATIEYINILLHQNAELEKALNHVTTELEDATSNILMRGFLFKWRDHEITFTSKWAIRYFVLRGNILSCYLDENERHPRNTLDLSECMVVDEGISKKNFHIFSLYVKQTYEMSKGPQGGALFRLSSNNASESNKWITLLDKACNLNKSQEQQRSTSPKNAAEPKTDTEDNTPQEGKEMTIRPILNRVQSSQKILKNFNERVSGSPSSKSRKKLLKPSAYPATKSMHLHCTESPLSTSAKEQNFKGYFNLGIIIMFVSHFGVIMDNLLNYGFLVSTSLVSDVESPTSVLIPVIQSLISWALSITVTLLIEILASRKLLNDSSSLALHSITSAIYLVGPCVWVYFSTSSPVGCMLYLFESVIIWLKLISYVHVNRDLRLVQQALKQSDKDDTSVVDTNAKPADTFHQEVKDIEYPILSYPSNLTVPNLLYFCVAPTLCYQLNYPRSKSIRWDYVATLLFRLLFIGGLIIFISEQHISPVLKSTILPIKNFHLLVVFQKLLAIAVPNTYVWLAGFYFYFHLFMNLLAELTRFGDRKFYLDWWNSRSIDEYWRKWNLPVHQWVVRHLYYPLLRKQVSRNMAVFACFLFSAIMHEVVISIPFRHISCHAFLGMVAQAPLVLLTKKFNEIVDNPFLGNCFFWVSFCIIGQPLGVILMHYGLMEG